LFYCSAANAVASLCEFLFRRDYHRNYDVSRLFIHYNGQILHGKSHRVGHWGVNQRHIILGMRKYGLCREKIWPYKQNLIKTEPSKEVYDRARYYTVVPLHLPCSIKAIETCLYHKIPVPVIINLPDHARTGIQANHGVLPMPNLNKIHINGEDLHAVLLVGYDQDEQRFIVRNSYGNEWVNIFVFYHFIN
jgi:C1A family cysteine protease